MVKHALQKPDGDTLIEQSVKSQNAVIKQHFAKHDHDILSIAQKYDRPEPKTNLSSCRINFRQTVVWIS